MTAVWLFGPALVIATVVFALVDWQSDPGGAWPPFAVAAFTAVPTFVVVFAISAAILLLRWLLK